MVELTTTTTVQCRSRQQALNFCDEIVGTDPAEKAILFDSAARFVPDGYILEIGADLGQSAIPMAIASKMNSLGKVISIDIDRGRPDNFWNRDGRTQSGGNRWKLFIENLVLAGVQDWVIPIGADSMEAWELLDVKLRMLYIDGNHDRPHTENDILRYSKMLKPGGFIFVHDYWEKETGTYEVVNKLIRDSNGFRNFYVVNILACAQKI